MNRYARQLSAAFILGACALSAGAQEFPSRPVTLVVPFPPGGVVDVVARMVSQKMAGPLGASIIVENRPGAGGTLGASYVAKARPDGYTVLMGGSATQVFGPAIYQDLQYDARRDFAPVGQISSGPLVVVVGSKVQARTMPELTAYLRDRKEQAFYGSNGNGTFPHLAAELFKQSNALLSTHVPYGGGPAVMTALVAGDIAFSINHIPVVQGLVKAGKVRALATTGRTRSVAFPDLPTLDESGMPGFEANAWWGLFAPAGTPQPAIDKLNAALADALRDEAVRSGLAAQGDEVAYSTPQDFSAFVAGETEKWTAVVRKAGLKVD